MTDNSTKKRILFVCLGNICRSPAAEGIFRAKCEQQGVAHLFEADSAGTYGGHAGEQPDGRMREAAWSRGYKLSHKSRQVGEDDFENFDLILAMDDNNFEALQRLAPSIEAKAKVERFARYVQGIDDVFYVPDPYYEGQEGFYKVMDILEDGCKNLIDSLI